MILFIFSTNNAETYTTRGAIQSILTNNNADKSSNTQYLNEKIGMQMNPNTV